MSHERGMGAKAVISESYVTFLKERHKELEQAIETETNRPMPDGMLVQLWKRQKLRIKDKLQRIQVS